MVHAVEWWIFGGVALGLLAVDLLVINRRAHVLSMREATTWSAVVVATALLFGVVVYRVSGATSAVEYYTGYLVELTLSVDNLFVFILIFSYFSVPEVARAKVLNWGIFGAAVMRGIMVVAGTVVLSRFEWLFIVLGVILLITAGKMMRQDEERIDLDRNPLVRIARRVLPMTPDYQGAAFLAKTSRGWLATPLVLVVVVIEWTDVVFAIDSIPAIFAITRDPFIVYSSNMFAILGLRAMFFVISDAMGKFRFLKPGVGLILGFVGVKMILIRWVHPPPALSLGIIVTVITASIALSVLDLRRRPKGGAA